jgi:hypothetical protein
MHIPMLYYSAVINYGNLAISGSRTDYSDGWTMILVEICVEFSVQIHTLDIDQG